jgi:hypothetical protein
MISNNLFLFLSFLSFSSENTQWNGSKTDTRPPEAPYYVYPAPAKSAPNPQYLIAGSDPWTGMSPVTHVEGDEDCVVVMSLPLLELVQVPFGTRGDVAVLVEGTDDLGCCFVVNNGLPVSSVSISNSWNSFSIEQQCKVA